MAEADVAKLQQLFDSVEEAVHREVERRHRDGHPRLSSLRGSSRS